MASRRRPRRALWVQAPIDIHPAMKDVHHDERAVIADAHDQEMGSAHGVASMSRT
jgi:hypothetical protein